MRRFAASRVAVVGIGGVGSYAVEALARTGIGSLLLIDDDTVEPSNINRQIWALESTLGKYKVEVARARLLDIDPTINIDARAIRFTEETASELLASPVDFVVDAIDTVANKVALLAYCTGTGIPVISCMGAAGRSDPTRVRISWMCDPVACPLARRVRHDLRKRGVQTDIPIVCTEEPVVKAPGRGPLPSCCAVTAAVGLAAAAYVSRRLAERT